MLRTTTKSPMVIVTLPASTGPKDNEKATLVPTESPVKRNLAKIKLLVGNLFNILRLVERTILNLLPNIGTRQKYFVQKIGFLLKAKYSENSPF